MPALAVEWVNSNHNAVSPYSEQSGLHKKKYDLIHAEESPKKSSSIDNYSNGVSSRKVAYLSPTKSLDGIPAPKRVLFDASRLQLQWQQKYTVGAGLENLGNTCFLNSVLQCLCYTPPLAQYLSSNHHKNTCKATDFCMLCVLCDFLKKMLSSSAFNSLKPLPVLQNLRSIAKCLTWGQQEDAHEFLRYVVDAMQKSCLSGINGLDEYSKGTTVVHQIFGGYLRSQVKCDRCSYASNTYDPLLDISVDLRNADSLEQALKKFVQPESLDIENAYKCERCQVKVTAQKRFTIHRPSNVLTVHLKRFDMSRMLGAKVSRHISFSHSLNIRPYMSSTQGEPVMYSLYGVLVHSGYSCNSGHYYSYVRAPDNGWHCMNDSMVSKSSINNVLNADAYILFYVRCSSKAKIHNSIPHTITKSDLHNGSGDHSTSNGRIIGPQLPPAGSKKPFGVNSFKLNTNISSSVNRPSGILANGDRKKCLVPYSDDDSGTQTPTRNHLQECNSNGISSNDKTGKGIGKLSLKEYTARQDIKAVHDPNTKDASESTNSNGDSRSNGVKLRAMFTPRTVVVKDVHGSKTIPLNNGRHETSASEASHSNQFSTRDKHRNNGDTSAVTNGGGDNCDDRNGLSERNRENGNKQYQHTVSEDATKQTCISEISKLQDGASSSVASSQSLSDQDRSVSNGHNGNRKSLHHTDNCEKNPFVNDEPTRLRNKAPQKYPHSYSNSHEHSGLPLKRSRSPHSYSRSPHCRIRSPHRRTGSPRSRTISPRSRTISPHRRTGSPHRRTGSPHRRTRSPHKRTRSPHSCSRSSHSCSRSPRRPNKTPRKYNRSPYRRSRSPRRRSRSPYRRSRSPRRRSRSHRRRSRSHRRRSRSPYRRSRSPRRHSKSPLKSYKSSKKYQSMEGGFSMDYERSPRKYKYDRTRSPTRYSQSHRSQTGCYPFSFKRYNRSPRRTYSPSKPDKNGYSTSGHKYQKEQSYSRSPSPYYRPRDKNGCRDAHVHTNDSSLKSSKESQRDNGTSHKDCKDISSRHSSVDSYRNGAKDIAQVPEHNGKTYSDAPNNKHSNRSNGKKTYSADDDRKPLISSDSEDEYQWVEVTKENLQVKSKSRTNGVKSKTTWYDRESDDKAIDKKEHDKPKSNHVLKSLADRIRSHHKC